MSKFTAGEWMLDNSPDEYNGNIFTYEPDGSYIGIARIKGLDYIDFKTEAQANARLIAAAPKMYERLKLVARLLSRQAQGQLRDPIDPAIADSIYEILAEIDNEPVETMKYSSSFFQNRNCEYFPCHEVEDTERFSCLFCFCPLYHMEKCPGSPQTLSSGVKDCTNCTLPHTDYEAVIRHLKQEAKHERVNANQAH